MYTAYGTCQEIYAYIANRGHSRYTKSTTMGLFDDILDIGKEFKSLRDEVVGGVTDVVSSVSQPIEDVRDSIKESTKELKDSVDIDNASK